jgi:hypothetical protein
MRAWRLSNWHRRIRNDEAIHAFASREKWMTRTVTGRIDQLENRLGIAAGEPKLLFVASAAGRRQALDVDTCVDILRECGFLPTGLTAQELERFLRKHGPEICGARGVTRGR